MATLLEIREYFKSIYAKYDIYVIPVLKFILAFVTLTVINGNLGYMDRLGNPAVVLVISLLCSFLPINILVVFAGAYCVLHTYELALECGIVVLAVFMIMYLLYFRFVPSDALIVLFTPICFVLKIPYIIPVAAGLCATPVSVISAGCGVVIYYVINYIASNSSVISNLEVDNAVSKFKYIVDNLLSNKEMIVMIVAFAVTVVLVYLIRRLQIEYAWSIASGVGIISCIVIMLVGDMALGVTVPVISVLTGALVSFGIAAVLQFFLFSVDYTRTEFLQFEDDEYYYYVKAVPKLTVAVPEKKVQHINSGSSERINKERGKKAEDYPVFNQSSVLETGRRQSASARPQSSKTASERPVSRPASERTAPERSSRRASAAMDSDVKEYRRSSSQKRPVSADTREQYVRSERHNNRTNAQKNYVAGNGNGPRDARSYSASRAQSSSMAAPRNVRGSISKTESLRRVSSPTRSFKSIIDDDE